MDTTLLGALIGVGGVIVGVIVGFILTAVWESFKEKREFATSRQQLARALLAEVEALLGRYREVVRAPIEQ